MKKVVILSGTSCVGKTPLLKALQRTCPEITFGRPVLFNSREKRPTEKEGQDYYFRTKKEIKSLAPERYVIGKARNMLQAVDTEQLFQLLGQNDLVIFDIHPKVVKKLLRHPRIEEHQQDMNLVTVFMQPASDKEILDVRNLMDNDISMQEALASIQVTKLIQRAHNQGMELTATVMKDIHIRANAAWEELMIGTMYDHIIVNHEGEESLHWNETPPAGEAGETLEKFVKIIKNEREA